MYLIEVYAIALPAVRTMPLVCRGHAVEFTVGGGLIFSFVMRAVYKVEMLLIYREL